MKNRNHWRTLSLVLIALVLLQIIQIRRLHNETEGGGGTEYVNPAGHQVTRKSEGVSIFHNTYNPIENNEPNDLIKENTLFSIANSFGVGRKNSWVQNAEQQYTDALIEFGVSEEKLPELIGHRAKLVEYAGIDQIIRQEMQKERFMFLEKIKDSLTPEMYELFVDYERIRGGEREFVKMSESGYPGVDKLDSQDKANLMLMLVDNGMLTTESWDGPLDPLPNPLVGTQAVTERMQQEFGRIEGNLPQVIELMKVNGFDHKLIDDVKSYYEYTLGTLANGYSTLIEREQKRRK